MPIKRVQTPDLLECSEPFTIFDSIGSNMLCLHFHLDTRRQKRPAPINGCQSAWEGDAQV
ncbi:hypothetical protein [Pseudomonas phage vB_Pae_CF124b]|nr:hypothetical protein [Pseudomonas phage vB_Pae_CF124b]